MKKIAPFLPFFFLTLSCLKRPTLPEVETSLRIPIIDTTYQALDFFPGDSLIKERADSLFEFRFAFPMDTLNVGESMTPYTGIDTTLEVLLGGIAVDSLASIFTTIFLKDFNLPSNLFDTLQEVDSIEVYIPPLGETTFVRVDTLDKIHTLWGSDARIFLDFDNALPIDITPATITVQTAGQDKVVLFSQEFELTGKAKFSKMIDIPDVFLESGMEILIETASPGSGQPVWVKPLDSLSLKVVISSLTIDSAQALFPADTLELEITQELGAEFSGIDTILLKRGSVHIELTNNLPFNNFVTASFPSLDTSVSFWVSQNSTKSRTIDLKGRSVVLMGDPSFSADITVSHPSGWAWLTRDDRIDVSLRMDQLVPTYVSGDSLAMTLSIDERDTLVPRAGDFKGIGFEESYLRAHITSFAGVKGDLTLNIKAQSKEGTEEVERHIIIPREQGGIPGATDTILDISGLFQRFPKRISFGGTLLFTGKGFLDEHQSIWGAMEIVMPSKLKISPDTIVSDTSTDTTKLEEKDLEDIKAASLNLLVKNHTPLGASITITIEPPAHSGLTKIQKNLEIPPPPSIEGGRVVKDTTLEIGIPLNEEEIVIFTVKPRRSWISLVLETGESDTVTLRTTDFVSIRSYAELRYRILGD